MKLKLILVGNSKVGKTSIISQYYNKSFSGEYITTISTDKITKEVEINNTKINLQIWDTAGQEKYRSINQIFMKNTNIAILVYDITNRKSFEDLVNWYNQIIEINNNSSDLVFAVVGNKSDLYENQEVNKEEGESFCMNNNINLFKETSAKDFENIDDLFNDILLIYINEKNKHKKEIKNKEIDKNQKDNKNENENENEKKQINESIQISYQSFLMENKNDCTC